MTVERKGSSTAALTATEVKASLARSKSLTSEEEKVVRMRHGVGADRRSPLPRAAGSNAELADELLLIEMQLLRAQRARASGGLRLVSKPSVRNAAKDKIVRALRKKR